MKKLTAIILTAALLLSLTACAEQETQPQADPDTYDSYDEITTEQEYQDYSETPESEHRQVCEQLLAAFPDEDDWINNAHSGDIPFLACHEFITHSLQEGGFEIGTVEELASFNYFVNTQGGMAFAVITADIDLAGYEWAPMGWSSVYPNMPFSGWILGEGHTISNMTMNAFPHNNVGFLGWSVGAMVMDLNIVYASVAGGLHVGIMNGQAIMSNFENSHVHGRVRGRGAGSFLGHHTSTLIDCTATVFVNGEPFAFLTYNDYARSQIEIENPVVLTIEEDGRITRPEVDGFRNLGWEVYLNGTRVLSRNAQTSYCINPRTLPGLYEVFLSAFVNGQYVAISNTVRYEVEQDGNIIAEDAIPVQNIPFAEQLGFLNHIIDNPLVVTIDENNVATRPDIDINEFHNLRWSVFRNGRQVIDHGSPIELTFSWDGTEPGYYELFLNAFVGGGYVPVSNIVSYTIY